MSVQATLTVKYGTAAPLVLDGVGVAAVNPIVGGDRLVSLLVGPIFYGGSTPTSSPPRVTFTDPSVNIIVKSYGLQGASGQRGFFSNLSHATTSPAKLTQNTLPIAGIARICLLFEGCLSSTTIEVDLTQNGLPPRGIGIGGIITADSTPMGATVSSFWISLRHQPWQLAPATLKQSIATSAPGPGTIITVTETGYVHGPASNTSTAAKVGGTIQLIAPTQVFTEGIPGEYSDTQAMFTRLTLNFVPEPGSLLLLGPGVVSLALLGRRRMRS
jgi:hypothetical protein